MRASGSPRAYSPGDDKGGGGVLFVIARRERSEGRGNPSYLGTRKTCLFAYWFTVDRHARKVLAMTRVS